MRKALRTALSVGLSAAWTCQLALAGAPVTQVNWPAKPCQNCQQPVMVPSPYQPAYPTPSVIQPTQPSPSQPSPSQPSPSQPSPTQPSPTQPNQTQTPPNQTQSNPAAQAPTTDTNEGREGGTEAAESSNPNMFGDFGTNVFVRTASGRLVPATSQGPFKLVDNGSPFPQNSFGVVAGYYNNVLSSSAVAGGRGGNALRETIFFEKAFLDNRASLGFRLPFIQSSFPGSNDGYSEVGDLNLIGKYVLHTCRENNSVVSAGLSVVVPTGPTLVQVDPYTNAVGNAIHPTIYQPFVGYATGKDFFIQGFTALAFASQSRFPTLFFQDIGVGYWLYRDHQDSFITGVAPAIEAHLNIPLDQGIGAARTGIQAGSPDQLVITSGVNFIFGKGSSFGLAGAVPVAASQRTFDFELQAALNIKY